MNLAIFVWTLNDVFTLIVIGLFVLFLIAVGIIKLFDK